MKSKLAVAGIVALIIGFVGIAGGFTKRVAFTEVEWCGNPLSKYVDEQYDPENPLGLCFGDYKPLYTTEEPCHPEQGQYCYYKTEFDPRSTAMFVMVLGIIGLIPLTRKSR